MDENTKAICGVIRGNVSAIEAGRVLGLNPGHDGRCKCFFHGGDHRNLKLYPGERGYYCFVCHEHGDVIGLVMGYLKCTFPEALAWLNDSFGLGLDLARDSFRSRVRHAESYMRGRTTGHA